MLKLKRIGNEIQLEEGYDEEAVYNIMYKNKMIFQAWELLR